MAQQTINVGTAPNDGTGTPLRTAFQYTNSNFSELYTAVGPSGNNIVCPGSATITGDLTVDTSTLKVDSANNRVGIVNASPSFALDVNGAGSGVSARISSGSGTGFRFDTTRNVGGLNRNYLIGCDVLNEGWFSIVPSTALGGGTFTNSIYNASYDGTHTWNDGAGSERMRLNSTGLGVGVSPAAKIHVKGTGRFDADYNLLDFYKNNGSTRLGYLLFRDDGVNFLTVTSNQPLAFYTNNTEQMRIDTSGNVGIGVTPSAWVSGSPAVQLKYNSSIWAFTDNSIQVNQNAFYDGAWKYINAASLEATNYYQNAGKHIWRNAAAGTAGNTIAWLQAMTLDASGRLLVGTTSQPSGVSNSVATFKSTLADWTSVIWNSNAVPFGLRIQHDTDVNGSSNQFWFCYGASTVRAELRSNGGLANYQANNVNLSDIRTKTDIKPLASYWNKIKSLELVTFKYKDQTHSDDNIGLIAQQVESVAPELVDVDGFGETPDDGVPIKTIYTTDLYHAAIKALQEAMTRIEALEAKLA